MHKQKVLVFGAGAVGTYIGGSLALAGHQVVFLEQAGTAEDLQKGGMRLDLSIDRRGRASQGPQSILLPPRVVFAASLAEAFDQGSYDLAIYALKSFDTQAIVDRMKEVTSRLPPLLCLSNGVENEEALSAVLGREKVLAGTLTSSIARRAAGDIVLERKRGVGVEAGHPLARMVTAVLNEAGLNARLYPRAADMKWSKMLTNLPANATAAILDMPAGEVFSNPGLFRLEMRMLGETLAVMKAMKIHVTNLPRIPVKLLALGVSLPGWAARPLMKKAVGGGRGGKMPSFHIDLHAGRGRSEVEWLNGAVVRFGRQAGVPTPVNARLTEILVALTRGDLPPAAYSRQPQKFLNEIGAER